jgi:CRP-like cAMP-binding protein
MSQRSKFDLPAAQNVLIQQLPPKERKSLLAICESVELVQSEVLSEAGARTRDVYFPTRGFISLMAVVQGTAGVAVDMIGREGVLGAELALGLTNAPLRSLVLGAGSAWRIEASAFRRQIEASEALRRTLHRYLCMHMAQLSTSAACFRFHLIGPRLARWLLMTQDRAQESQFHATHECLANMLGVRRVGITVEAGELQRRGLIRYQRGDFTILDREGLEALACPCYSAGVESYANLMT